VARGGGAMQESATRALKGGATLDTVLEMVSRVAPELKAPMVLFTYFNPLLSRGFETVIKRIADAGVKGTSVRGACNMTLLPRVGHVGIVSISWVGCSQARSQSGIDGGGQICVGCSQGC
jgi:hypothetical protein